MNIATTRLLSTLFSLSLVALTTIAQAQTVEWLQQGGGGGEDGGRAVAVDALGNVFVSGFTRSSLDVPNAGRHDAFVSKYTLAGELVWTRQKGTTLSDYAWGVATDRMGGVVTVGQTAGALVGTHRGNADGFVGKYSSEGELAWSAQLGSNKFDYASSVTIDMDGNSYFTGRTNSILGTKVGATGGSGNTFVGKYASDGSQLWVHTYTSSFFQDAMGIAHAGADHLYATGSFRGGGDIFLRQYDSEGMLAWDWNTLQASSMSAFRDSLELPADLPRISIESQEVAADPLGNVFIVGSVGGSLAGFVSRFDSTGDLLWTRKLGDAENRTHPNAVSTDGLGNVFVAGRTSGNLGAPNAGGWDAFVSKYDAGGDLVWTTQLGTTELDFAYGVDATLPGTIFVAGSTRGALGVANLGDYDYFLAKITDMQVPEPASFTLALLVGIVALSCRNSR